MHLVPQWHWAALPRYSEGQRAALLQADGHCVKAFALEQALPHCTACAEAALAKADCAILPLPCEKDGVLNAPFSAQQHTFRDLLQAA